MSCAGRALLFFLLVGISTVSGKVVLMGRNRTVAFDDVEASFAPPVNASGQRGMLYLAKPLDACSDLTSEVREASNSSLPFVLIIRGGCSFESKVRKAQKAGYRAAIIYDNENTGILISMIGDPYGIEIHAVFVSKAAGETLKKYSKTSMEALENLGVLPDMEFWLLPSLENSAWSVMAISFISLLAIAGILALCFFLRRQRVRPRRRQSYRVREFYGMSAQLVESMPSLIFTAVLEDNCTSSLCAICLEDYHLGDKLRILPCQHKFHALCVDSWLTSWRTFCPVCKRDARKSIADPPASESTPLLSSMTASESPTGLSSGRTLLESSSNMRIFPASQSPAESIFSSPDSRSSLQLFQRSFQHSPPIPITQSSVNLRNSYPPSSYRSPTSSHHSSFLLHQQSQRMLIQSPPTSVHRRSADHVNLQGSCLLDSSSYSSVSYLNAR